MTDRITPYPLRMPPELREELEEQAKHNKRSLNAEIISILESSLKDNDDGNTKDVQYVDMKKIVDLIKEVESLIDLSKESEGAANFYKNSGQMSKSLENPNLAHLINDED